MELEIRAFRPPAEAAQAKKEVRGARELGARIVDLGWKRKRCGQRWAEVNGEKEDITIDVAAAAAGGGSRVEKMRNSYFMVVVLNVGVVIQNFWD